MSSRKSLLDLNDHCLLKVFSYLNIIDLINMSDSCTKLQLVAKTTLKKNTIFRLWDYKCYRNRVEEPKTLDKIFDCIAPFIGSLELISHKVDGSFIHGDVHVQLDWQEGMNLNRSLEGKIFTNLKSLEIDDSRLLQWIQLHNLEELKIGEVKRNDLNKFTEGLPTLKKLNIGRFHNDITTDEMRCFLEKSPNIEFLEFHLSFPLEFPYNILPQLRNLTKLSLAVDYEPSWCSFLNIETLTELKVAFGENIAKTESFIIYLENLAQKKTLKKMELEVPFQQFLSDKASYMLQMLDVSKLRITVSRYPIFPKFNGITLLNLTHLDVMSLIDDSELFHLIEKSEKLESLKVYYREDFNNATFLNKLPRLFNSSTIRRPTLTLINYKEKDHVMVKTVKLKIKYFL